MCVGRWAVIAGRGKCQRAASERGSGTVLVVAVLGAVVLLAVTMIPLGGAFVASQGAANAADAAALAAADVASGLIPGVACEAAARAASVNGAALAGCELKGAVAQVSVTLDWSALGWAMSSSARARAGPPGSP